MGWAGLAGMVGIGLNQPMGPGGGGRGKFGGPWCWSGFGVDRDKDEYKDIAVKGRGCRAVGRVMRVRGVEGW